MLNLKTNRVMILMLSSSTPRKLLDNFYNSLLLRKNGKIHTEHLRSPILTRVAVKDTSEMY